MKRIIANALTFVLVTAPLGCGSGCAAASKVVPALEAVMQRTDAKRLLSCLDAGDARAVAKCLGARALTEGLRIALEEASRLAEDAELATEGGAGASDLSSQERDALAAELDQALDRLAVEVEKANR